MEPKFSAGASLAKISSILTHGDGDFFFHCLLIIYSDPHQNLKTSLNLPQSIYPFKNTLEK